MKRETNQYKENLKKEYKKELKKYMIKSIFLWIFLIAAIIGVGFYGYIYVFEKGEYNLLGMKDTIIPNFHSIEIYSNNMYNPNFAEVGDTITIKLKATEELSKTPSVKINGQKVKVEKQEKYYYYVNYKVEEQSNTDEPIFFNVYDYEDLSGNQGKVKDNTTDDSFVYIIAKKENPTTKYINVKSVILQPKSKTLVKGTTFKLNKTILPSNSTNKNVTWVSSDESIVKVNDKGIVTAISKGEATIKVITEDGNKEAITKIKVINPEESSKKTTKKKTTSKKTTTKEEIITTSRTTLLTSITTHNTTTLKPTTTSTVTTTTKTTTTSKKPTPTTTKATTTTKKTTTTVGVSSITLNVTSISLNIGDSKTITATINPSNAANKNVTWSSSNTSVVTVSNGVVKAIGKGTATITVKSNNGKTATVQVTVLQPATGISLNKTSLTIKSGLTAKLTATVSPSNANNKNVTWTSSNTSVVTVDGSGNLYAKKAGTATITAKTHNGKTATAKITVKALEILFVGNSKTYYPGKATTDDGIPKRVKAIAANRGYSVNYVYAGAGGKTLLYNYNNYKSKIESKTFDVVIMQEQNDVFTSDKAQYKDAVTKIVNLLKKKNKNVKVYIRAMWTTVPSKVGNVGPKYNTGKKNTEEIAAGITNAKVIYDGVAMYAAHGPKNVSTDNLVNLFSDERHQNKHGAYLSGACIFSTVFNEDPRNISINVDLEKDSNSTGNDDILLNHVYNSCYKK